MNDMFVISCVQFQKWIRILNSKRGEENKKQNETKHISATTENSKIEHAEFESHTISIEMLIDSKYTTNYVKFKFKRYVF